MRECALRIVFTPINCLKNRPSAGNVMEYLAANSAHCGLMSANFTTGDQILMNENAAISWHFERDPTPYALETDWPVGAGGVEPLHFE
jgi:hypothetical protein